MISIPQRLANRVLQKKERGLLEWCIQLGKLNKGPQIVLCAKSITSFVYSVNVALYYTEGHACSS